MDCENGECDKAKKKKAQEDVPKYWVHNMVIIPGMMGISHGGDIKELTGYNSQMALHQLEYQEGLISEALGNSEEFLNAVSEGLGLSKKTVKKMLGKLLKKKGGSFDIKGKTFTLLDVVSAAYDVQQKGLEGVPFIGGVFATNKNEIDAMIAVGNAWDNVLAGPERIEGMTEMANVVLIFTNENLSGKTEVNSKDMKNTGINTNYEKTYIYYGTQHGGTIHIFGRYNNPYKE